MAGNEFFAGESGDIVEDFGSGENMSGQAESGDYVGDFGSGDSVSGQAESGTNEYFFSDGIGTNAVGESGSGTQSGSTVFGAGQQSENIGKEEKTPFLVDDASISGQALEESIVNALLTVFADDEIINVMAGESEEISDPAPTPTVVPTVTPSPSPTYIHDIDDIYEKLESIENYSALTYADNLEYHKSQDIIGRATVGLFSVVLGGLVIVAFIGRIR